MACEKPVETNTRVTPEKKGPLNHKNSATAVMDVVRSENLLSITYLHHITYTYIDYII